MFTQEAWTIFQRSIDDYHKQDHVDADFENPYPEKTIENLLYRKNWIDTVQWHLEDIIRDPEIQPEEALKIKRRIDGSNQDRTDLVEYIDSWFYEQYQNVKTDDSAKLNTESPAWAVDRLSILALKIYHMAEQANRQSATPEQRQKAQQKLDVLMEQKTDLMTAIQELMDDYENGNKVMKVYKQMKMYNDADLNPVLYKNN